MNLEKAVSREAAKRAKEIKDLKEYAARPMGERQERRVTVKVGAADSRSSPRPHAGEGRGVRETVMAFMLRGDFQSHDGLFEFLRDLRVFASSRDTQRF